jgi:molecular chaperone GrpE
MAQNDKSFVDKLKGKTSNLEDNHTNKPDVNQENNNTDSMLQEIADWKDKAQRIAAELVNTQQRMNRDKEDAVKYASSKFISELALCMDSFFIALNSIDESSIADESFKTFFSGYKMMISNVSKLLEKHGVKTINPINEKFDPNYHEAVSRVKVEGYDPGIVVNVFGNGYTLNDRVIRPAMVVVSE